MDRETLGDATGPQLEIAESLVRAPRGVLGESRSSDESSGLVGRYAAYRPRLHFHVDNPSNRCDAYCVSSGMLMAVVDVGCTDSFESRLSGQDIVEFHYRLSGSVVLAGSWGELSVKHPSCLLWYQPLGYDDAQERMGRSDCGRETWVSLYCDRTWLSEIGGAGAALLLDRFAIERPTRTTPQFRLCSPIGALAPILKEIVRNERRDAVEWLFATAKAHELLYLTLRNATALAAEPDVSIRLTARDRRQLAAAHEILAEEFASAPSLSALGRRVGMNASKLCFGFKKEFGETTSGFVRRLRLEFAHQLLTTSDLQVRHIARRTGYHHHSTFTAAFARHFGVAPKLVRHTRARLS